MKALVTSGAFQRGKNGFTPRIGFDSGVSHYHDAPVGDLGEVGVLFGASVRNNHHLLQVWKAYAEKRRRKLHLGFFWQHYIKKKKTTI